MDLNIFLVVYFFLLLKIRLFSDDIVNYIIYLLECKNVYELIVIVESLNAASVGCGKYLEIEYFFDRISSSISIFLLGKGGKIVKSFLLQYSLYNLLWKHSFIQSTARRYCRMSSYFFAFFYI